ncbi:MAG: TonB-dependent receptor [Flavobacteriales bacterium]|nr:TonB-dependent receptor [Flavobacteriales bacterium]
MSLSGYIRDAETGEELIGATVYIEEIKGGTTANLYGYYTISLAPGTYNATFNYLGYQAIKTEIELTNNVTRDMELIPDRLQLEAVEITSEKANRNVSSLETGVSRMDAKKIKDVPQFMGEVDIIRTIQLMPGVTTVGEGATGFNVRGGNIDQNLILLDEATMFNTSHLFGFFSVFNADAVKDISLYRGGIPAKYGGRLSSVLDVRQKEGNSKEFAGNAGIGLISSRLMLEGPIVKDKASFMIAGRRSYGDILAPIFNPDLRGNQLFFYDLNAKLNYTINNNNRIFFSAYTGADEFRFDEAFASSWGNTTATLRWNHLFSPRMFSNFTAVYSDYTYSLGVPTGSQAFNWQAGIQNYDLKADFTYQPNMNHSLDYGVQGIFYTFSPGRAEGIGDDSFFNVFEVQKEYAAEMAAYIGNKHTITDQLSLQYGLRYSRFLNLGARDVFLYADDNPNDPDNIIGSREYNRGEVIADYGGFEPRFSANYTFNQQSSVKLGYNRMRQYIHLVSNTTAATPLDIWTPSGKYVEPAIADQLSLGYYRNFKDNTYEASIEVYYKDYQNLLDYRDNAQLLLNQSLETELLQGIGRAYGMELQVQKVQGRFTGWISYTLARSEVQVEGINRDEWYPSNWDKLHDVSVVGNYRLSDKWQFGAVFSYMSGRPITYPDGRYVFEGIAKCSSLLTAPITGRVPGHFPCTMPTPAATHTAFSSDRTATIRRLRKLFN